MLMKKYLFLALAGLPAGVLSAQTDSVYTVVDQMPRYPGCEEFERDAEKLSCSNEKMLAYIYERIQYPQDAIEQNIEGTVVVSFVVNEDGSVSDGEIVRDLGGNTGLAALRVILRMQADDIRWTPGKLGGRPVKVRMNVPVRFKLEDPAPFVLVGRDTVYTTYDTALDYEGGQDSLQAFLDRRLRYPEQGNDSCHLGQIDMQLLIESDGDVRILDMTDFNDLGFDFWYAAIDASTATRGGWIPATFEGRPVNSSIDLSLTFMPTAEACGGRIDQWMEARALAQEGANKFNEGEVEAGLEDMTEALRAFPRDAQLLILRGQAYLENSQMAEACADLRSARRIALVNWFDNILPIICRPQGE